MEMEAKSTALLGIIICAVFLVCAFVGTAAFCCWYVYVEWTLHRSWERILSKFFFLSLGMGISSSLAAMFNALYLITILSGDTATGVHMFFWNNIFILSAVELHVRLLYVRTIGLVNFSRWSALFLKLCSGMVVVVGCILIITSGLDDFVFIGDHTMLLVNNITNFIISLAVVSMDISTAVIFSRHIRQRKKLFASGNRERDDLRDPPTVIASTGVRIAIVSLLTVGVLLSTGFYPAVNSLLCLGSVLWIHMKIRLERISQEARNPSRKSEPGVPRNEKVSSTTGHQRSASRLPPELPSSSSPAAN
jgi:hypothetical protein